MLTPARFQWFKFLQLIPRPAPLSAAAPPVSDAVSKEVEPVEHSDFVEVLSFTASCLQQLPPPLLLPARGRPMPVCRWRDMFERNSMTAEGARNDTMDRVLLIARER